jgi:hypothetical protein
MLSIIRRRVTFANVALTVALVFAMSGGAFAAGKFLITSTKQISPKVLKSLQGKAGPAGANGAQGTAGPAGPAGPQGPAGAPGAKSETGAEGKEGKEGKAGKDGKAGLTGSPWTAGGTLPSGSTETGTWTFAYTSATKIAEYEQVASFPIRLSQPLAEGHAHLINSTGMEITEYNLNAKDEIVYTEVAPTDCGSAIGPEVNASNPQAKQGNLCVYVAELKNTKTGSTSILDPALGGGSTAGVTGALLYVEPNSGAEQAAGSGTWAVTAE